jgi:hypothetical protein
METTALLIKQSELQKYLVNVTNTEQEVVLDLAKIIPFVTNEKLRDTLQKRFDRGQEALKALKAGYVPLAEGWFTKTDTKSKWQAKEVKRVVDSMPPEVKEIWEKAKEKGIFDSFSVTIRGGGDPLLVGNKGKMHFFITGWLPICPGVGIGLKIRL